MPIALPPVDVFPGDAFPAKAIPAANTELRLVAAFGALRVRGLRVLDHSRLGAALRPATSLADAANALGDLYQREGWRNVLIAAFETGGEPTLVVYESGLARIEPQASPLLPYFEPFLGVGPIDYGEFAQAASLAERHAQRIGFDASALYLRSRETPDEVAMAITGTRRRSNGFDWQLRLGNTGNRFVGRWFGGVDASYAAESSWRIGGGYARLLTSLGDTRGDPEYDGYSLFTDRVFTWGTARLSAARADYRYSAIGANAGPIREVDLPQFDARSSNVAVQLERFLGVTPDWTWTAGLGVLHDDYRLRPVGSPLRYTAAQLSVGGEWKPQPRDDRWRGVLGLRVRQSLQENSRNSGFEDAFDVYAYSAALSAGHAGPGRASFAYEGQWSDDVLPQAEQWVLGGIDRLFAWLPGVAVGDRGTAARLQYELPLLDEGRHKLAAFAVAEYGSSEFEAFGLRARLADAGLRLRYQYATHWMLELLSAKPIYDDAPAGFDIDRQEVDWFVRGSRMFDAS
jgi:hypothetical protein